MFRNGCRGPIFTGSAVPAEARLQPDHHQHPVLSLAGSPSVPARFTADEPNTLRNSMRIRRRLPIPLAVLLIVAAVALIVTLRKHAPPEAARLLPGADGFFYINLEWVRKFNATSQLPPLSREPEYHKFDEETGFQFERDLDKAAFAVHYPQNSGNGTGGSHSEP